MMCVCSSPGVATAARGRDPGQTRPDGGGFEFEAKAGDFGVRSGRARRKDERRAGRQSEL